jgi:hypothetical protein
LEKGWKLLDAHAHYPLDAGLVEGGQLLGLPFAPGHEKKQLPSAFRSAA